MTAWIDVTDFLHRQARTPEVTGIQRALSEMLKILHRSPEVRFCAFEPELSTFVDVAFDELSGLISASPRTRRSLFRAKVKKSAASLVPRPIRRLPERYRAAKKVSCVAAFRENDILCCLSAFWYFPDHNLRLLKACFVYRMKLAVLIYDLIPARHPEWFGVDSSIKWSGKLELLLRGASFVFAISRFVASDVAQFARERKILIPDAIVLEFGDPLRGSVEPEESQSADDPYVLMVGSIDLRKNQSSLLPVWSRLLKELGEAQTPRLILIGENGMKASEFHRALGESRDLSGKISVLRRVDDRRLSRYYKEALFTIFPTLAEGWGFPVAESLSFGKVCIASDVDSVREVGGELAYYVDPRNPESIYDAARKFILDGEERKRWEDRIRSGHQPRKWETTVETLLAPLV